MKILILLISLSFINCKKNTDVRELDSQLISEITKAVVLEEDFNNLKNERKAKTLCEELIKLDIKIPEKVKNDKPIPPPPPFFNDVTIEELLNTNVEKELFFTSKDSLHLMEQNMNPLKFKITKEAFLEINLTTKEKEINKKKRNGKFDFYEMTIPIISSDNQKAYVLLNHYCGHLCGNGKVLYLKKINGHWKIIQTRNTWIS